MTQCTKSLPHWKNACPTANRRNFLPWTGIPNLEELWTVSVHGEAGVATELLGQSIVSSLYEVFLWIVNILDFAAATEIQSLYHGCAFQLAGIYKNVVGTDTSAEQLSFAEKLPNIRYQHTTRAMPIDELQANVASHQSIDLVTVAQAFHWFDRPTFYQHVKLLLKSPNGVLAVWCYTLPRVKDSIDAILARVYADASPFGAPRRKMVDDEYRTFEFPFEPVEGTEHTGPFEFEAKQSMNLDEYLTYIRSWSAYRTARQKGFELLREEVIEEFRCAWGGEDEKHNTKVAKFPVFLRIGKVGK